MLSQETVEKKKRCAKTVMSADTEDVLIETPCLYQKGLRDTLAQCSNRCFHISGLTGAHCSQGVIPCFVCSFWVSDPDHCDRGRNEPVSVFFNKPGKAGSSNICLCGFYFESLNVCGILHLTLLMLV